MPAMTFRVKGFTTSELVVSLALAGVAMGLAVPSLAGLAENAAVIGAHNDLRTAIGYSRAQAVQLSTPVALCASADLRHCSGDSNWTAGWLVFTDGAGAAGVPDAGDRVLRVWSGPGTGRVAISARIEGGVLRFNSLGATSPMGAAAIFNLRPANCPGTEPRLREIVVGPTGAVHNQRIACT
jgi:type IV fimbrial biogenesis protein FimT